MPPLSLRDLQIPYLLKILHDVKWWIFGIIWIYIIKSPKFYSSDMSYYTVGHDTIQPIYVGSLTCIDGEVGRGA